MPVVTDEQIISLHTATGVQLYQFLPNQYLDMSWSRMQRDVSRCDVNLPPQVGLDQLPDIVPWFHWCSVWDGPRDVLLWSGPIQRASANRNGLSLSVRDHAAYLARTRDPITKRWDAADPAWIARELWADMLTAQGLNTKVIDRPDPEGDRFDFQVLTDEQMLDQTMGDLVDLGLFWTVVSNTPVLGPLPRTPVAVLGEEDFLGDGLTLVRDGSATFNDVLVRGPDNLARAREDYGGQNLQTIVNIDNMFGVSNVARAAQQYIRYTGQVRTTLELASGTYLHPDAPLGIDELMPSARFVIEAHGLRQLMELTSVEVARRQGETSVKVTMDKPADRDSAGRKIELDTKKKAPTVTLGGEASK